MGHRKDPRTMTVERELLRYLGPDREEALHRRATLQSFPALSWAPLAMSERETSRMFISEAPAPHRA